MSKIVFNFVLGILATYGLASKDTSASTRALMNNFGSIFQYIESSEWYFHRVIVYSQRPIRYRKTTKQVVVFAHIVFFLSGVIFVIKVWKGPFARIKFFHMHRLICQPWMTPWIDWSCHDHTQSNYDIFLLGFKSHHLWLKFSTVRGWTQTRKTPCDFLTISVGYPSWVAALRCDILSIRDPSIFSATGTTKTQLFTLLLNIRHPCNWSDIWYRASYGNNQIQGFFLLDDQLSADYVFFLMFFSHNFQGLTHCKR